LEIHQQTHSTNDFIRGWYIDNKNICDEIVNYHKNSNEKMPGQSGGEVRPDVKESTDVILDDAHLYFEYNKELQKATDAYGDIYPYVHYYAAWTVLEDINIQKYDPGKAYYGAHCERGSIEMPMAVRHMVFMTYLNDVEEGGETEFIHQGIKVKPEKGLTLIWPADWTFTHRGIVAPNEEKYIATGWYSFIN